MTSESERLERLEKIIEELNERSQKEAIIVEGLRDIQAMRALGITGIVRAAHTGDSIMNLCESLSTEYDRFIILTDWDRKGGQLASLLRKGLEACGARYDNALRAHIARLTKKEIKDVEGLPRYLENLGRSVRRNPFGY